MSSRQIKLVVLTILCLAALAGQASAAIEVWIIRPATDPFDVSPGVEQEYEAVAFLDGEELPPGDFTWEWDFGDNTPLVTTNPALHTYADEGSYIVTVRASAAGQQGQDDTHAHVDVGGGNPNNRFSLVHGPTGGDECDLGGVGVTGEDADPFTAHFYVSIGGDPELYTGGSHSNEPPSYHDGKAYRFAGQPAMWSYCPNKPQVWRVEIHYDDQTRGPDVTGSFGTNDTYVRVTSGDLIMVHAPGSVQHDIAWTISHLDPATSEYAHPHFKVTLQILDIGGGVVFTKDLEQDIGAGQYTWFGETTGIPEEEYVPFGLYTFRIWAGHRSPTMPPAPPDQFVSGCWDQDKANSPELHVTSFTANMDYHTLTATFFASYRVDGAGADLCKMEIYNPNLVPIASEMLAPLNVGDQGTVVITKQLPPGGPWGTFYAVFTAMQLNQDARSNRDRLPKWAQPEGATAALLPIAKVVAGQNPLLPSPMFNAGQTATIEELNDCVYWPRYATSTSTPVNAEVKDALETSAVFADYSHGYVDEGQTFLQFYSIGEGLQDYLYSDELDALDLSKLRLAVWYACESAAPGKKNFVNTCAAKGVESTIGWKCPVSQIPCGYWASFFWMKMKLGTSSSDACYEAVQFCLDNLGATLCSGLPDYDIQGSVSIVPPARFRE